MRIWTLAALGFVVLAACSKSVPSEQELFERARSLEEARDYNGAIEAYDMIISNYPDSPNRYKAIFMKGYIFTDLLRDKKRAIEALDTLLLEYPDCDLADDAKIMRDVAEKGTDLMSIFQDSLNAK